MKKRLGRGLGLALAAVLVLLLVAALPLGETGEVVTLAAVVVIAYGLGVAVVALYVGGRDALARRGT